MQQANIRVKVPGLKIKYVINVNLKVTMPELIEVIIDKNTDNGA